MGLNEVPTLAIRGISSCREAMYGGFWKSILSVHQHMDLPLGQSDIISATKYSQILPRHGGNDVCEMFFGEEGYGRISGGTRVLEMAADSREATPWCGAR
jgi:hypothetical protein